jgi:hypothetical protein
VARDAHQASRLVEMDDVQELVREHEAQPAVVVAEVLAAVRSHRAHVHQRIRQGSGEAVGVVLDVRQDEVHPAHVHSVARFVPLQDLGGERGRAARHLLEALVEVHGDAVGGDAAEAESGGKDAGAPPRAPARSRRL